MSRVKPEFLPPDQPRLSLGEEQPQKQLELIDQLRRMKTDEGASQEQAKKPIRSSLAKREVVISLDGSAKRKEQDCSVRKSGRRI